MRCFDINITSRSHTSSRPYLNRISNNAAFHVNQQPKIIGTIRPSSKQKYLENWWIIFFLVMHFKFELFNILQRLSNILNYLFKTIRERRGMKKMLLLNVRNLIWSKNIKWPGFVKLLHHVCCVCVNTSHNI